MILKKGKTNWIFLAIFIILSIIFGGEIIYNVQSANKEFSLLEKPLGIRIENVKINHPSSTKPSWQHYQNKDFGISLDYPSDWEISMDSCSTPFWGVSKDCLRVETESCALYIAKVDNVQYEDILSFKKQFGEKEVEIGGQKAIKIDKEDMPYLLKTKKGNFVINPIKFSSCANKILSILDRLKFLQ